jgi:hypothetical protein
MLLPGTGKVTVNLKLWLIAGNFEKLIASKSAGKDRSCYIGKDDCDTKTFHNGDREEYSGTQQITGSTLQCTVSSNKYEQITAVTVSVTRTSGLLVMAA